MKVVSLYTKQQYILVTEDLKQRKIKSIKEFVVKNKHFSTRGFGNLSTVCEQIGDMIYWIDPS